MGKVISKGFSKVKVIILVLLVTSVFISLLYSIYVIKNAKYKKDGMISIFDKVQINQANLTEYIVYGTHLNIKGEIEEKPEDINEVNLVFAYLDGTEKKIDLNYEATENALKFYTSDLINTGIDLEDLKIEKHYLLIEVKYGDDKTNYYSIRNKTEYDEILYYTISKHHSNNKVSIQFCDCEVEGKDISYMVIDVKNSKLPKEVYDIVIDPGHGGADTGAEYGGYEESVLTLEYGKMVKSELEKLGFKVKITRDGTEDEEKFGTQTVYDKDGRVNIVRTF